MTTEEIVAELAWTLEQSNLTPRLRAERMRELLQKLWDSVYSGLTSSQVQALPSKTRRQRWPTFTTEIEKYSSKERILKAVGWLASGGDLAAI